MNEPTRKPIAPARAAEWWVFETQTSIGQQFTAHDQRFNSRRKAIRAAKRYAEANHQTCRVVRVLEVRMTGEKDRVYPPWKGQGGSDE